MLFFSNLLSSQEQNYWFRNISVENGLSQNTVLDITQDSLNYMWIATPDGLNKYDGTNFTYYPISFDFNVSGTDVRTGRIEVYGEDLWMIVRGGRLEKMALKTGDFCKYLKFNNSEIVIPPLIDLLIEDDNKIWLATRNDGVYLVNRNMDIISRFYATAPLSNKISSDKINKLFKDSTNKIWILTDNGINEIQKNHTASYLSGENIIWAEELFGNLFFGNTKEYQFVLPVNSNQFHKSNAPKYVHLSHHHKDDAMQWLGTYGQGLYLLDKKYRNNEHLVTNKNRRGTLSSNYILCIFEDSEGAIWIGTEGGGINYFDKSFRDFHFLDVQNLSKEISLYQTRAITKDKDNNLWLAADGNLIKQIDEYSFQRIKVDSLFKTENKLRINALRADKQGNIWMGTHGRGIAVINSKTNEKKVFDDEEEKKKIIWCLLEGSQDNLWAGSQSSGLISLNKSSGEVKEFSPHGADNSAVKSITRINDSLIAVGFDPGGIQLFSEKDLEFQELSKTVNRELKNVVINTLYYLNNWLWIGTSGKGLYAINLNTGKFINFGKKSGLTTNIINGIVEENSRKLWISTNEGLLRLTYEKVGDKINIEEIQQFHPANGLQGKEFIAGSYYKDTEGTIYFGGINGLNFFTPDNFKYKPEEIDVRINEVLVDNIPIKRDTNTVYLKNIQLSYNQNSLALTYSAPNYLFSDNFNYQYMLEGYDKNWINSGSRNFTSYTNLPPGDYKFKVRLNNVIHKFAPVSTMGIHIDTPFWRTWWFIFLIITLIILVIYSVYRYRLNRWMEMQKVKDKISADLHDDLGSRLTSINLLSAIYRNQKESVTKVLEDIEKEVRASSEALDEIVWNIRLTDESVEEIIAKIIRYAGEFLESADISYKIIKNENFSSVNLKMHKRRELFLISKEIINNIVRHSNAQNVTIEIRKIGNSIRLIYHDDGRGFDPQQITHRNGLVNLKKRIKNWKGQLEITSEINKGTTISISLPVDKPNLWKKFLGRN
ncbi:ligand-binding sensor domain-containing protein [Christiangramia fulva]|uniref:ligand-binding sensor domain-containing protein n=1 Tax=Christiangramia fulva TaxID=2126553 RepID=UPI00131DB350|nr:sensor histidine kinase [Christiangramia fulva]